MLVELQSYIKGSLGGNIFYPLIRRSGPLLLTRICPNSTQLCDTFDGTVKRREEIEKSKQTYSPVRKVELSQTHAQWIPFERFYDDVTLKEP